MPGIDFLRNRAYVSLGLLGLAAGSWVLLLVRFWGSNPGYADRFLILIGAGYAARLRLGDWGSLRVPQPILGFALLLCGGIGFALLHWLPLEPGVVLSIELWLQALSLIVMMTGWLLGSSGLQTVRHFAFPILFPLMALPIPGLIQTPLQARLQSITTLSAYTALQGLSYPVKRVEQSFELILPGGRLGVEEACSGVRSLTALTALAAFVAFLRGFGPVLGTCLLASSIGVVILVNIVRVVLSGIIQEATDRKYIMGAWHEGLGFALVFVGLAGILACAKLFDRLAVHEASPGPASQAPQQIQVWKVSGMTVLTLALVLGVAAWPHLRETESQSLSFPKSAAALPQRLHHWEGVDQPVDDFITSELAAAEVLHRQYQDNLGRSVETWVIRWDSAHPGRGYHHPDICLPARGYRVEKRWDQPIATSRGTFTATARILRHEQHGLMVLYWTEQDGRVWTHEEEADAEAMMGGYPAMKQAFKLLVNGQRLRGGLRQTILIGVPDASGQALDLAEEFARHLFEHLSMTGSSSAPQTRPR